MESRIACFFLFYFSLELCILKINYIFYKSHMNMYITYTEIFIPLTIKVKGKKWKKLKIIH